jgi:hypothetical protein
LVFLLFFSSFFFLWFGPLTMDTYMIHINSELWEGRGTSQWFRFWFLLSEIWQLPLWSQHMIE